jgi:hypothetical protein
MGFGKWLARGLGGLLLLGVAGAVLDAATYDEAAWGADFERLKGDMAQGYANLDWIAERRGLDLAIAARVSEMFGGTARLDAVEDRGTTVVLDWPTRLPTA